MADLHVIAGRDLDNIPEKLRQLADAIERGDHGPPEKIARLIGVLRADDQHPIIFGFGSTAIPSQAFEDLHAGAAQLLYMNNPAR